VAQAVPVMIQPGSGPEAKELIAGNTGKASRAGKNSAALASDAKESKNEVSFNSLMNRVKEKLTGGGTGKAEGEEQYAHLLAYLKSSAKGILHNIGIKQLISLLSNFLKGERLNSRESDIFSGLLKKLKNSHGEEKDVLLKKVALFLNNLVKDDETALLKTFEKLRQVTAKTDSRRNVKIEQSGKRLIPKLVVLDLRKQASGRNGAVTRNAANRSEESVKLDGMIHVKDGKAAERQYTDTVLSFSTRNGGYDADESGPGTPGKQGHLQFDQHMMKSLRENLSKEMVKHTRIIVREDGTGELRIVLKPESLGSIRMRLNMQNNHIDGRIIVENNNVRNVVESALDNLQHALQQEGFNSISLKVSVGNEHRRNGEETEREPEVVKTGAIEEFEKNIPVLYAIDAGYTQVNLVV
jgi:flagellar hook-length control protein FliK